MLYNGIDLIDINRIEQAIQRWGDRFLQRVFTAREQTYRARPESLAARWAAKEATAKMLGVGLRGLGSAPHDDEAVSWTDIETINDEAGRPMLQLHGRAAEQARRLHITDLSVSLSHTRSYAIASVVALSTNSLH
ncbi:MAG: holo-ACP synthase [Chloroflexota bacterium]